MGSALPQTRHIQMQLARVAVTTDRGVPLYTCHLYTARRGQFITRVIGLIRCTRQGFCTLVFFIKLGCGREADKALGILVQ